MFRKFELSQKNVIFSKLNYNTFFLGRGRGGDEKVQSCILTLRSKRRLYKIDTLACKTKIFILFILRLAYAGSFPTSLCWLVSDVLILASSSLSRSGSCWFTTSFCWPVHSHAREFKTSFCWLVHNIFMLDDSRHSCTGWFKKSVCLLVRDSFVLAGSQHPYAGWCAEWFRVSSYWLGHPFTDGFLLTMTSSSLC